MFNTKIDYTDYVHLRLKYKPLKSFFETETYLKKETTELHFLKNDKS